MECTYYLRFADGYIKIRNFVSVFSIEFGAWFGQPNLNDSRSDGKPKFIRSAVGTWSHHLLIASAVPEYLRFAYINISVHVNWAKRDGSLTSLVAAAAAEPKICVCVNLGEWSECEEKKRENARRTLPKLICPGALLNFKRFFLSIFSPCSLVYAARLLLTSN